MLARVLLGSLICGLLWFSGSLGGTQGAASPREVKIQLHKKLALAHQQAVRCLESGQELAVCDRKLTDACPGGTLETCVGLSENELKRHSETHELGGIVGKGEPQPD